MTTRHLTSLLAAAVALVLAGPAIAQEEDDIGTGGETAECVSLRQLRKTDVIDDRHILFYVRGKGVFLNVLPRACNGLERENRFTYRNIVGRLCSRDGISVLYATAGGMQPRNSCALGVFHKITREDAKALKETLKEQPPANPLPMPEPQEVDSEPEPD